jgi:uncharacterized protein (TIGR03663 family)
VHAYNFRGLLENGVYEYDPYEYHGPTLNYFTLIPARLTSANEITEVTETTVRIVPVFFGVALILLTVLLAKGLGFAAVIAAALVALSPAMVFYSRYYIQEMLLVCFTFGVIACGYRYGRTKALPWAILTGIFAGLMHATKETAIISFGAMGLGLIVILLVQSRRDRSVRGALAGVKPAHVLGGLAVAVGVSALFYSAFFTHPRGVLDSYLTYATYLGRAHGHDTVHIHPWYYYLRILLFARYAHGPIWTEGWIVLLALVGTVAAIRGSQVGRIDPKLVRFLAVYTIATTVVYSAVPYKTPWCLLTFLHGMILLAGVGAVMLLTWVQRPAPRIVVVVLLLVAAGHLAFLTYRANFVFEADSRNPYVYAHPTPEVFTVVEKVKEYAGLNGLGESDQMPIQVMVPGKDYWPLPWYLRSYKVGWYTSVPEPNDIRPFILVSDILEGELAHTLYQKMPPERTRMYMYLFDQPYYVWFRPGVKLMGFVRKDLWEQHSFREPDPAELLKGR